MANYQTIQFIAYQINTSASHVPTHQGSSANSSPPPMMPYSYKGSSDSHTDLLYRCVLMQDAILNALYSPHHNTHPGCLKIFIAPEFYFRNTSGAYKLEETLQIIDSLRYFTSFACFTDWLFIFGTILSFSIVEDKPGINKEIYNFSFIQKGGYADKDEAEQNSCIVMKEFMSPADFQSRSQNINCIKDNPLIIDEVRHLKSGGPGRGKENIRTSSTGVKLNYEGLGIFDMDNIRFGVEICRDNRMRRLYHSRPAKDEKEVQIHIIVSSGLLVKNTIACHNGYSFTCDGYSGSDGKKIIKQNNMLYLIPLGERIALQLHSSPELFSIYSTHFTPGVIIQTPEIVFYSVLPI